MRWKFIWERNFTIRAKVPNTVKNTKQSEYESNEGIICVDILRAMFVLHSEKRPHPSAEDLRQTDQKTNDGRMLNVLGEYYIKHPVETQDGIQDHGDIVILRPLEAQFLT